MSLTETQKQLVTQSFARIIPISDKFAKSFYNRLWEIAPETKALFANADMTRQRMKLIATIASIVNSINSLQVVIPTVRELGVRHQAYGVAKKQYDYVGEALLWALEQEMGSDFTPEIKDAWATVYNLLAEIATETYVTDPNRVVPLIKETRQL